MQRKKYMFLTLTWLNPFIIQSKATNDVTSVIDEPHERVSTCWIELQFARRTIGVFDKFYTIILQSITEHYDVVGAKCHVL